MVDALTSHPESNMNETDEQALVPGTRLKDYVWFAVALLLLIVAKAAQP